MATPPRPYSIHVYLPNGTPEGLRIIDKSNWTGRGVYVSRSQFPEAKTRHEFQQTGTYVLVGPPVDGDLPEIYVGQAETIGVRLAQHHSQTDFWTWAVFFVSKDGSLNRAHAQYLESKLIALAAKAKRSSVKNGNAPQPPGLTEWEQADVDSFLSDMLSILPLVGLTVFEEPTKVRSRLRVLEIAAYGITARGYESGDGFVVTEGSEVRLEEVRSIHQYLSSMRRALVEQGVLVTRDDRYVFAQDYEFSSPSTAAGVVQGRAANGRVDWKDKDGRTLRDIQASEER